MRNIWRYTLVFIVACLLGYAIGYGRGAYDMLNWGIDLAIYFMEVKGIEIDVDSETIIKGIDQYKNQVGTCYPELNITEMPT